MKGLEQNGIEFAFKYWSTEVFTNFLCLFVDDATMNQHHYQLYLQKQQNYFAQGGGGGIGAVLSLCLFHTFLSCYAFVLFSRSVTTPETM